MAHHLADHCAWLLFVAQSRFTFLRRQENLAISVFPQMRTNGLPGLVHNFDHSRLCLGLDRPRHLPFQTIAQQRLGIEEKFAQDSYRHAKRRNFQ